MTPLHGHAAGVFTLVLMFAFIGMWIWAWLPRHRQRFGRLARLPMEDLLRQPGDPIPPADEENEP